MRPETFVFSSNAARVSQKVGHPWSRYYTTVCLASIKLPQVMISLIFNSKLIEEVMCHLHDCFATIDCYGEYLLSPKLQLIGLKGKLKRSGH